MAQCSEQRVLGLGHRDWRRRARRGGGLLFHSLKLFEHVAGGFHELGALAQQCMATARLRGVDGAGYREHLAPLFAGQARGDQRARLERGLDHQRPLGQARDDTVALRKVLGQRW